MGITTDIEQSSEEGSKFGGKGSSKDGPIVGENSEKGSLKDGPIVGSAIGIKFSTTMSSNAPVMK